MYADTENEDQEADLDILIYGNPELPAHVTQHLPEMVDQMK
jgi:hypothetical protein